MSPQGATKTLERHKVQLYETDDQVFTQNVGRYLREGLDQGKAVLVIAAQSHAADFMDELRRCGADPDRAAAEGRLLFLDAEQTLAQIMIDGQPDRPRFEALVNAAMRKVQSHENCRGLRAYGELVGCLWKNRQFEAAIQLEGYWNALLQARPLELVCGYPIDVFGKGFRTSSIESVLSAHSQVAPIGVGDDLKNAVNRAIDEVLNSQAEDVRRRIKADTRSSRSVMPPAEAAMLWIRDYLEDKADEVSARARAYYHEEKRFRALIENNSDAISLLDADGRTLYASESTTRVLGYGPQEFVGRRCVEQVHPEDTGDFTRSLQEALEKPRHPVYWQARLSHKLNGWCWVEGTATNFLQEPDVRAIVANYRDITSRKASEADREKRERALARSSAEMEAFAYAAAHDLREPLRTIAAFSELLKLPQSEVERAQCVDIIIGGVNRISALLDGLLTFTRLEFTEADQEIELQHVVQQAMGNLERAIRSSDAVVEVGTLPAVQANEPLLVEVFQNLIGNAIRYRDSSPPLIRITSEEWDHAWVVKVSDNGIGIAPQYHERIFGLFKRLHGRDVPGTGIGLAVCKKIVEGLGGRIWVDSEPGLGATFCFTIIRKASPDMGSAVRSAEPPD
ncbi:MAG TPA: ATP-binding protein [Bryobacteraceae bacterium]|nr:ATP-binding protein [Bryobacteraceae bacterium]